MEKRLYRSSTNKIIAGLCGGLGQYMDIDPVILRLISVILIFATGGVAILVYFIAWLIVPKAEEESMLHQATSDQPVSNQSNSISSWKGFWPGIILISIGLLLVMRETWYWFHWDELWPIILIGAGLYLILRRNRKRKQVDNSNMTSFANNHEPKTENGGSIS
ncbi:MAG: PspC domain-containing protein [Candidatus Zixiibacteriota bacterium]